MSWNKQNMEFTAEILIIDEVAANVKQLSELLTTAGFKVQSADSCQQGLDVVVCHVPDLILLNVFMPDMDSFELCHRIKSLDQSRDIPVIFISAVDDCVDKEKGFLLGGADFIYTPIERPEVLARINTHLSVRRMRLQQEKADQQLEAAYARVERLESELEERVQQRTTELEHTITELREREEHYHEIVEGTDDLITRVDNQGCFVYVNHAALKAFGISPEECIGLSAFSFIDVRDQERTEKWFAECLNNQVASASIENRQVSRTGEVYDMIWTSSFHYNEQGGLEYINGIARDITERRIADDARRKQLYLLESLEKVECVIREASDLDRMMEDVLETVRLIFDCDRAWFLFPCDPEAASWRVPMERTRLEYPGAFEIGEEMPMTEDVASVFRDMLKVNKPIFGLIERGGAEWDRDDKYGVRSFISMALHPKVGKPWDFGLHQCSYARIWTDDEKILFNEIGNCLAGALSSMLSLRILRENEAMLARAQQIAHLGGWVWDLTSDKLVWSDEMFRITGLAKQEMTRELAESVVYSDDLHIIRAMFDEAMDGAKVVCCEFRIQRPDGEIRYMHDEGELIQDRQGKPVRMFCVMQDITERKEAEKRRLAQLHFLESLEQIDRVIRQSSDMEQMLNGVLEKTFTIYECDRVWLLHPCDPDVASFRVPLEYTRAEYPGARTLDIEIEMTPDRADDCRVALAMDKPLTFGPGNARTLKEESGAPFFVQSQIFLAVYPRTGKPWMFGMHQCSFARVWSQEEQRLFQEIGRRIADGLSSMLFLRDLRCNEENLRTTLNSIGDAVIATDINGNIVQMNPVAEKLTGWSFKECEGDALNQVFHIINAYTREGADNPVEKVLNTGEIVELSNDTVLVSREGMEYQIADSGAPIRSDAGETVGVVLVFRDVTEEYALQEQLRQSQKMEAIGQLAGGVAHDFNNMLSGIIGAAELLKKRLPEESRAMKFQQMIMDTAGRAADLTDKLLTFARKRPAVSIVVNINDILRDMVALLENTIDRRIQIEIDLMDESSVVIGDPSLLQSAFLNLGINAAHAMPNGGTIFITTSAIELDVACCRSSNYDIEPGAYIEIKISDTGCGIAPEDMSRVFEPFFTTKDQGKGTGLGLAAVYGSVQQHNGAINVTSKVGEGTCFQLLLPVGCCQPIVAETTASTLERGAGCILVVDDEEVVRDTVKITLEDLGYEVLLAKDGIEALALFEKNSETIDLVVLDMIMPKMNGRDCFAALQRIKPDVRVILTSGFAHEGDFDEMRKAGLYGLIRKPYLSNTLSQAVHDALSG